MNKLNRFFAAAALTSALVFAQGPGMGRMGGGNPPDAATRVQFRVEMLAKRLSLTDAQKTQATTIYTDAAAAVETARANVSALQTSLADAVKANNTGTIDTVAAQMGTINGQVLAVETKAEAAFYAILTPEQQTKFDSMPHGPGGMGMGRGSSQAMRSRANR